MVIMMIDENCNYQLSSIHRKVCNKKLKYLSNTA